MCDISDHEHYEVSTLGDILRLTAACRAGTESMLLKKLFPDDHPERRALADEVHARPSEGVDTPSRISHLAVLIDPDDRGRELQHLDALCRRLGLGSPGRDDNHYRGEIPGLRIKWERHGEFSGYTVLATGIGDVPFEDTAAAALGAEWLQGIPGPTVAAVHVEVVSLEGDELQPPRVAGAFGGREVVASAIADGAARVYTDFRIHADGFTRFVLLNGRLTREQAGRTVQRLVEIEAYRLLSLLALPIARRQSPRIQQIERALATLTDGMARGSGGDDEVLLQEIMRLAAEVESGLSASQFRFGACRAYFELVQRRIAELREARLPGLQTLEEFMARRLTPAVATVNNVSARLAGLSERVSRASGLLSTRVDINREQQNQALLASMDRRAKMQLRLQQTVEGLSVAAIVYYLAGLVGYLAKGVKAAGVPMDAELAVGAAVPLLALAAIVVLRRAKRRALGTAAQEPH